MTTYRIYGICMVIGAEPCLQVGPNCCSWAVMEWGHWRWSWWDIARGVGELSNPEWEKLCWWSRSLGDRWLWKAVGRGRCEQAEGKPCSDLAGLEPLCAPCLWMMVFDLLQIDACRRSAVLLPWPSQECCLPCGKELRSAVAFTVGCTQTSAWNTVM